MILIIEVLILVDNVGGLREGVEFGNRFIKFICGGWGRKGIVKKIIN